MQVYFFNWSRLATASRGTGQWLMRHVTGWIRKYHVSGGLPTATHQCKRSWLDPCLIEGLLYPAAACHIPLHWLGGAIHPNTDLGVPWWCVPANIQCTIHTLGNINRIIYLNDISLVKYVYTELKILHADRFNTWIYSLHRLAEDYQICRDVDPVNCLLQMLLLKQNTQSSGQQVWRRLIAIHYWEHIDITVALNQNSIKI